jgi:4-diphosphocytidyl-2-C-methyl-D-erythritol kinase
MRLEVVCPAKINTFLAVGQPDSRGWHPLRTIFQAVDLCDDLIVETAETDSFTTNAVWLPPHNSVTKALAKVRGVAQIPPLKIQLIKRIPAEAGLGGGSSNAAGLLRAAAFLVNRDFSELALSLGADVPFFLIGGRAKGEGYGEKLEPLPDLPTQHLVIVKPDVGCSTVEMYKELDRKERTWRDFPTDDEIYNDFLSVAPQESTRALKLLKTTSSGLTGSGSAVFGFFPTQEAAQTAAQEIAKDSNMQAWAVRTLTASESQKVRVIEN